MGGIFRRESPIKKKVIKKKEPKNINVLQMAKKKRHIFLLEKFLSGKHLSRSEIKELEVFEGGGLPASNTSSSFISDRDRCFPERNFSSRNKRA